MKPEVVMYEEALDEVGILIIRTEVLHSKSNGSQSIVDAVVYEVTA
jgi:hypothetical protein